jgi:hypothetical protein
MACTNLTALCPAPCTLLPLLPLPPAPCPAAEYKLAKNIKIAMLYLEDDDAVSAETYIKKASSLLTSCKVAG